MFWKQQTLYKLGFWDICICVHQDTTFPKQLLTDKAIWENRWISPKSTRTCFWSKIGVFKVCWHANSYSVFSRFLGFQKIFSKVKNYFFDDMFVFLCFGLGFGKFRVRAPPHPTLLFFGCFLDFIFLFFFLFLLYLFCLCFYFSSKKSFPSNFFQNPFWNVYLLPCLFFLFLPFSFVFSSSSYFSSHAIFHLLSSPSSLSERRNPKKTMGALGRATKNSPKKRPKHHKCLIEPCVICGGLLLASFFSLRSLFLQGCCAIMVRKQCSNKHLGPSNIYIYTYICCRVNNLAIISQ